MINETAIEKANFHYFDSVLSLSSAYRYQLSLMKIINLLLLLVFLINPEGIMVAKELSMGQLQQRLNQVNA